MKRLVLSLVIALAGVSFVAVDAEAKRLGGGGSSGMKRAVPTQPAQPQTPPPQQAAPQPAQQPGMAAGAMAQPAKRSWLGPVAGIAAGLGIAALASHFGLGGDLANLMTMLLLVGVGIFVLRLVMRRFSPAPAAPVSAPTYARDPVLMPAAGGSAAPAAASRLPADFDAAGFERVAKLIFIRMQAANDAADLEDLRRFSTPEMFATFRLDLQDRQGGAQRTDVVQLDAQVLDFAVDQGQQVVSVRFHGLIREEDGGVAQPLDEVWHLVKPQDGSREWAIAGIQQHALA